MKAISQSATKTFLKLIDGLTTPGSAKRLDRATGAFMAVSIDFLNRVERDGVTTEFYAVAHRYLQNGDLVPDPDVEFAVVRRGSEVLVCPTAIDQGLGYRRCVVFEGGEPTRWNKASQHDLASFCGTWMRNIKQQQGL